MPERDVSVGTYRPLKDYVRRRGGIRLSMHGGLRERVVEEIVAAWPVGCPVEHLEDVVRARISIKVREKYGSVIAVILLSAFINVIVRLVVDWWLERHSHRVLMQGWSDAAKGADV
jgi:hypothetical protein